MRLWEARFLLNTGSIHLKESGVQIQFQHFLLPRPFGIGIAAQGAQQLGAGSEAGGVVGTKGRGGPGSKTVQERHWVHVSKDTSPCVGGTMPSPVIAQVGKHVVEQTGDEWYGLLFLVTSIHHVQERSQNLKERGGR